MYPAIKLAKKAEEGGFSAFPAGPVKRKQIGRPVRSRVLVTGFDMDGLDELTFGADLADNRGCLVAELVEPVDAMVGLAGREACQQAAGGLGVKDQRVAGIAGDLFKSGDDLYAY